jgi:hypothetical protein
LVGFAEQEKEIAEMNYIPSSLGILNHPLAVLLTVVIRFLMRQPH